jgi:pilus assembly protein CpaE
LRKPFAVHLAKARTRRRVQARCAAECTGAPEPASEAEPTPAAAVIAFPRDDEPPFDPPDLDDMLGLGDCEEETEFVAAAPEPEPEPVAAEPEQVEPEEEEELELVTEPELETPEPEPLVLEAAVEAEEHVLDQPANDIEEEAFDPPDEADDIFNRFERIEAAFPPPAPETPKPLAAGPRVERPAAPPLPPITLHLCWDRAETAQIFATLAAERRFAAAEIEGVQGGIEAAVQRYAQEPSPDLLVLDTVLPRDALLTGVRRLFAVLAPQTKVVILAGVNDITLMRELAAAGISEYAVAPFAAAEIGETLCRLFEDADKSHVIAVIGARGGVGASTIAQNIAWSIAERQQASTALVDLDLAFGAVAANFKHEPAHSIAEALLTPDDLDEALDRSTTQHTPRLKLLSAPATVARDFEFDTEALQTVITRVRRTNAYVVLDLPHAWNDWIKQTLLAADSVLIVSGPDLASLRNADNMLKLLRSESARVASPVIVLSMVGVPKRPEIPAKDFSEALMVSPSESFAFDPALFAEAAIEGLPLGEHAPASKAARAIDELATLLTGRPALATKPAPRKAERTLQPVAAPEPKPQAEAKTDAPIAEAPAPEPKAVEQIPAPQPVLELVHEAPQDRFAEARKVGEAELQRLAADQPKPRKRTSGMLRATAAMVVFGFAGAWISEQQQDTAEAAISRVAPESPVIAAVAAQAPTPTPEAPPLDNTARYAAAVAMMETGQVGEGITELRALAEAGFAQAQYSMAKIYERGEGVAADAAMARQWTERAANAGHSRAMHDLGVYFARADGGAESDAAAFRWFRQAAEYGVADSQFNLGVFYQQGRSVSEDPAEALFWFMLAARDGDEAASLRVSALEEQLTPVQIENARARSQAFRPQTSAN